MTALEIVRDVEVVEDDFDPVRAQRCLDRLVTMIEFQIRSGVELADELIEARAAKPWRVDQDYRAARAAGVICSGQLARTGDRDPVDECGTWLRWRFNKHARYLYRLAAYGELRAIIAVDPTLPPVAEPEGAARPLVAKLLSAPLRGNEQRDEAARHEAIRDVWRIATTRTEGNVREAMAEALRPVVLKQVKYPPFQRLAKPSPGQVAEQRRAKIAAKVKVLRRAGEALLSLGAVEQYDEVIAELAETRERALR